MNSLRSPLFYFSISFLRFCRQQLKFQKIKNRITTTLINATFLWQTMTQNRGKGFDFVPSRLACTTGFLMNVGTKPLMLFTTFRLKFNVDPLDVFAF